MFLTIVYYTPFPTPSLGLLRMSYSHRGGFLFISMTWNYGFDTNIGHFHSLHTPLFFIAMPIGVEYDLNNVRSMTICIATLKIAEWIAVLVIFLLFLHVSSSSVTVEVHLNDIKRGRQCSFGKPWITVDCCWLFFLSFHYHCIIFTLIRI